MRTWTRQHTAFEYVVYYSNPKWMVVYSVCTCAVRWARRMSVPALGWLGGYRRRVCATPACETSTRSSSASWRACRHPEPFPRIAFIRRADQSIVLSLDGSMALLCIACVRYGIAVGQRYKNRKRLFSMPHTMLHVMGAAERENKKKGLISREPICIYAYATGPAAGCFVPAVRSM